MIAKSKGIDRLVHLCLAMLVTIGCGVLQAQVPDKLNYQGKLTNAGGTAINATVQMVFKLYSGPVGGAALYSETQTVTVNNGLFNVAIGAVSPLALPFDAAYYLGVTVGTDAEMTPREAVLASPYARQAASAEALAASATVGGAQITGSLSTATLPAGNLNGTIGTAQIANNAVTQAKLSPSSGAAAGKVLGTDGTNLQWQSVGSGSGTVTSVGTGTGLSGGPITTTGTINLAATQLLPTTACLTNQIPKWSGSAWTCAADATGAVSGAFVQGGNAMGAGITARLGTTDNNALEVIVNGLRAFRIEPSAVSPNVIGGSPANSVSAGARGATIGGGGVATGNTDPDFQFEAPNTVTDAYGTVAGGYANRAGDNAGTAVDNPFAAVGGGGFNVAAASYAVVAGGGANVAEGPYGSVGGGEQNLAHATHAVVAGGARNAATAQESAIGGGNDNTAGNSLVSGVASVVAGGRNNKTGGNTSTISGGQFNITTGDSSSIGGGEANHANGQSAHIGGGGLNANSCGAGTSPCGNTTNQDFTTIGGGKGNIAGGIASTIGGGDSNVASGLNATIGGGTQNTANDDYATIAGGVNNSAGDRATVGGGGANHATVGSSTVGGGTFNNATGVAATVSGGERNTASGVASIVVGGSDNIASGSHSVAMGHFASATEDNCMVFDAWTPSYGFDCMGFPGFIRFGSDRGVRFDFNEMGAGPQVHWVTIGDTNDILQLISTSSGAYLSLGGTWTDSSDRNRKRDFVAVDSLDVLRRVSALPISTWSFIQGPAEIRHMGTMAQDFRAAFNLGEDDKHISPLDTGGVALAAIQGLHRMLQDKDREIADLKDRVAQVEALRDELVALKAQSGDVKALMAQVTQLLEAQEVRQVRKVLQESARRDALDALLSANFRATR
jgi:hypothetical protein